jgi:HlyD family secretion protein
MRRTRRALTLLVVLGGVGALVWYFFLRQDEARTEAAAPRLIEVERGEMVVKASATGRIEPFVQVDVKSRTSGEVVEVLVVEGQSVEAGALLFRLDPVDAERDVERTRIALERLEAQLRESRAALAVAKAQAAEARADKLLSEEGADLGVVSGTAKRAATADAQMAAATVLQRTAAIGVIEAQLRAAALDVTVAERRLSETRIVAPFSGTVLAVNVEKGAIVASGITNISGGTALLTLADLNDLRVIGQIDEAQIARVAISQKVEIRVDAYPDRAFEGRVERVSPLGKTVSNVTTFDVEIVVVDRDKGLLRSGMSADVDIVTERLEGVLLVPMTAISSRGRDRFVKLKGGEERKVTTGPSEGGRIVVTEGLAPGDSVQAVAATPKAPSSSSGGMFGPPMGGGGRRRGL